MFILACGGPSYARLRFNIGPGGETELDVAVDYGQPFAGSDFEAWEAEYLANVHLAPIPTIPKRVQHLEPISQMKGGIDDFDYSWEPFEL